MGKKWQPGTDTMRRQKERVKRDIKREITRKERIRQKGRRAPK